MKKAWFLRQASGNICWGLLYFYYMLDVLCLPHSGAYILSLPPSTNSAGRVDLAHNIILCCCILVIIILWTTPKLKISSVSWNTYINIQQILKVQKTKKKIQKMQFFLLFVGFWYMCHPALAIKIICYVALDRHNPVIVFILYHFLIRATGRLLTVHRQAPSTLITDDI